MTGNRVLILGMGHMGQIYARYLDDLQQPWFWFDTKATLKVNSEWQLRNLVELKTDTVGPLTHAVICTPPESHYTDVLHLRSLGFEGKILIEKPGFLKRTHSHLLDDERNVIALVERFNPALRVLREQVKDRSTMSIDFVRCSQKPVSRVDVSTFVDVALHDIDLCQIVLGTPLSGTVSLIQRENSFAMTLTQPAGTICRFYWSNETNSKERLISVRQSTASYFCNLAEQQVIKSSSDTTGQPSSQFLLVSRDSPIRAQVLAFLGGQLLTGTSSFDVWLKLVETIGSTSRPTLGEQREWVCSL